MKKCLLMKLNALILVYKKYKSRFVYLLKSDSGLLKESKLQTPEKRCINPESLFCHSAVYEKMLRIVGDYKKYAESKERMEDADWRQLEAMVNDSWNNTAHRLQNDFGLTRDEIRLCCLLLTDLPISYLNCLLGCSRDSIYKKADKILEQRMGYAHKSVSLRDILRKMGHDSTLLTV